MAPERSGQMGETDLVGHVEAWIYSSLPASSTLAMLK